ncbi:glycosyltransferase family protein [Yersinia aleksiciae]|uniref:glycosyltransferase family 4 protein n=1 Tax=Yersinia aleksiciae TaxID=263819 RepID=UPI0011A95182|nr:glycosyltransferase family 4 protein [Yersinia aleksiciae]
MKKMKWAIISGDGLPTSGLLTIFRNVAEIAIKNNIIINEIPADLGFSWRPDKKHFFPNGSDKSHYPTWMKTSSIHQYSTCNDIHENNFSNIRYQIAKYDLLTNTEINDVKEKITSISGLYEDYFIHWFENNAVDWVFALNLTLSDAAPVSLALHNAAKKYWGRKDNGGIIFWDHDLFGSYAIYENEERLYPKEPNPLTPIPQDNAYTKWIVASEALANESSHYPTKIKPDVIPNILPTIELSGLKEAHIEFLSQCNISEGSTVVIVPVRVFRVKGIEISISVFNELINIYQDKTLCAPKLLIFGNMNEDPEYASELKAQVEHLNLTDEIIFLDEVPLQTYRDNDNKWHLDEIDLLTICHALSGAVLFTPNIENVESVGLGPALAAIAELPCAVTPYSAFTEFYGTGYHHIKVIPNHPRDAAQQLFEWMHQHAAGEEKIKSLLAHNKRLVQTKFPQGPWEKLIYQLQ